MTITEMVLLAWNIYSILELNQIQKIWVQIVVPKSHFTQQFELEIFLIDQIGAHSSNGSLHSSPQNDNIIVSHTLAKSILLKWQMSMLNIKMSTHSNTNWIVVHKE